MNDLGISVAQNGFVVYEGDQRGSGMLGKTWALESAESLSKFILAWGAENVDSEGMKKAKTPSVSKHKRV